MTTEERVEQLEDHMKLVRTALNMAQTLMERVVASTNETNDELRAIKTDIAEMLAAITSDPTQEIG